MVVDAGTPGPAPGAARRGGAGRGTLWLLGAGGGTLWLLGPPLVALTLFFVGPLVFVALSTGGADGFRKALTDPVVGDAVARTLVIAAAVTAATAILGTVYALALTTARGLVRGVLVTLLLTSFWISILVRTLGWELLYEPTGPLDHLLHVLGLVHGDQQIALLQTTAGMYPAMVNVMLPYMVLPIWAAFATVDPSQLQAARSLGARPLQVLWRVVLPQVRTGVVAGMVLVFTLSLGFYITPKLLGGSSDITVGTAVGDSFEATQTGDFSEPAALALLLVIVVVVLYTITDRVLRVTQSLSRR